MNLNIFQLKSLKTRVTMFTLVIFTISIWSLAIYASRTLRQDLERLLGDQQFSTATLMADSIDHELTARLQALEALAPEISPALLSRPGDVQAMLAQHLMLQHLFNEGVFVVAQAGAVVADVPAGAGRLSSNVLENPDIAAVLKGGQSRVGQPKIGRLLNQPVFPLVVPIRDLQGGVTGAFVGMINLGLPNFLEQVTHNRYGKTGDFFVASVKSRVNLTSSDTSRIMQPLPLPGVSPPVDRFAQGYEGSMTYVNSMGLEVLVSAKRIPVADWVMVASLPTVEAFAPLQEMQQRILIATLLLTLLAGALSWWMLRRELSPVLQAARTLGQLSDANVPPTPLAIAGPAEIGELIGSFNRLLGTLAQREEALRASEARFRALAENGSALVWMADADRKRIYLNKIWLDFTGRSLAQELGAGWMQGVHEQDIRNCQDICAKSFEARQPFTLEYRLRRFDGDYRWVTEHGVPRFDGRGAFVGYIGTCLDITELKAVRKIEAFRHHTMELLMSDVPLAQTLEALVESVEQFNPAMLCSILLLDHEGKRFSWGVAPSLPDFYNAALQGLVIGDALGSCGSAAFTGERVVVADIATHPYWVNYRDLAARADLAACWSQPIRSSTGQVLGTFAIYHRVINTPDDSDIAVIEQAAYLASIAIERSLEAEKLRDSEMRFRSLMENIPGVAVQGYALDGKVMFWNKASEQLYGYAAAQALKSNLLDLIIPPEMAADVRRAMREMNDTGVPIPSGELLLKRQDGSRVPVFSSHALIHPIGKEPELFCLDIDLSERKQAEEQLKLAASVFTHAREGITITTADARIVDTNEAFTRITGYTHDEVLGKNPRFLSSGRQSPEFYAAMWSSLIEHGYWQGEIWNRRKNGEIYAEMQTISAVRDGQGNTQHYVALFSDITAVKAHQDQLEHIAHFDALTGLPNRVLLADRLRQGMTQALRRGQSVAVAFLDLDGFKAINDRHGHDTGDQLLIALAARMKLALRDGDTFARMGGDEFVAVLVDLEGVAASVPMLTRLLDAAAQPVEVGDVLLQVSGSLGVTFYPQSDDVDADQLLRQADQAMYQAKVAGKNRYHLFDAEQDRSVRGHHESLENIRCALARRQFVLHYQPKVNMRTGAVIGAEALVRWQHPQKGLLPPAVFLPVIEDHALAVELGQWVIDTALTQMALWREAGLHIPVSVNVGARQLQEADFVSSLSDILAAHPDVTPTDLTLEVLETSALQDLANVSHIMQACREVGVMFALDDFGTGYSSLTYLKRLPVSQLKIDQSFVRDMLDDPDDLAILEGVIGLAAAFRRQVIAEGVETVEHGAMLLQLGCELAQGYGIARPMPAELLPGWAATWRPDAAWGNVPPISRADLPLLFASVEHRTWVKAVENYLTDAREAPPQLDHEQCHFGAWLQGDGLVRHGAHASFAAVHSLHEQAHDLATELCELKQTGQGVCALSRLDELHSLANLLMAQLKVIEQEGHP